MTNTLLLVFLPAVVRPPKRREVVVTCGDAEPVLIARWPSARVRWRTCRGSSLLEVRLDELRRPPHMLAAAAVADRKASVVLEPQGPYVSEIRLVPSIVAGNAASGGLALGLVGNADVTAMARHLAKADARRNGWRGPRRPPTL